MNKKIIDGIRKYYQLPNGVTDNQIAQKLKGSMGEVVVNLNVAMNVAKKDVVKAFTEVIPRVLRKYLA